MGLSPQTPNPALAQLGLMAREYALSDLDYRFGCDGRSHINLVWGLRVPGYCHRGGRVVDCVKVQP